MCVSVCVCVCGAYAAEHGDTSQCRASSPSPRSGQPRSGDVQLGGQLHHLLHDQSHVPPAARASLLLPPPQQASLILSVSSARLVVVVATLVWLGQLAAISRWRHGVEQPQRASVTLQHHSNTPPSTPTSTPPPPAAAAAAAAAAGDSDDGDAADDECVSVVNWRHVTHRVTIRHDHVGIHKHWRQRS